MDDVDEGFGALNVREGHGAAAWGWAAEDAAASREARASAIVERNEAEAAEEVESTVEAMVDAVALTEDDDDNDPPPPPPPGEDDDEDFGPNVLYYCVVPSAPAEQLCKLMSRFLDERGWEPWPHEEWFVSEESGEMLSRPAHAQTVGFCNCSSYCLMTVDIQAAMWCYDRLMLVDLAPDLCPPSYKIKAGELVDATAVEFEASREACMWFLKENGRNCGQGIDIFRTAAEALALAEAREVEAQDGREYVLQPHVQRPLLYEGVHKFHIRVYALIVVSPMLRYPRCFGYSAAYMHVSPLAWDPLHLGKDVQSVHGRSDRDNSGWYDI